MKAISSFSFLKVVRAVVTVAAVVAVQMVVFNGRDVRQLFTSTQVRTIKSQEKFGILPSGRVTMTTLDRMGEAKVECEHDVCVFENICVEKSAHKKVPEQWFTTSPLSNYEPLVFQVKDHTTSFKVELREATAQDVQMVKGTTVLFTVPTGNYFFNVLNAFSIWTSINKHVDLTAPQDHPNHGATAEDDPHDTRTHDHMHLVPPHTHTHTSSHASAYLLMALLRTRRVFAFPKSGAALLHRAIYHGHADNSVSGDHADDVIGHGGEPTDYGLPPAPTADASNYHATRRGDMDELYDVRESLFERSGGTGNGASGRVPEVACFSRAVVGMETRGAMLTGPQMEHADQSLAKAIQTRDTTKDPQRRSRIDRMLQIHHENFKYLPAFRDHLLRNLGLQDVAMEPKRVLLVSRDAPRFNTGKDQYRKILNRDEMIDVLESRGYTIHRVDFASMTVPEQIIEVRKANLYIGMHGAGMVNTMW
ncbi:hypothetical protein, variant [Sphaeroforma arctica JP610]|nr:hypothetical protein, variant [Sphaeroforma arctica JP610]KNC81152.1 hypothetical protein, variant [Sphaeroforma arctica JP610]|eukprot:XP_014155054.1 hypothetical protein, variant [Sphaeroforma arctica JP610]